ncbi:hypothetical protein RRG08_066255 [Elysia crispata]|uniref:Uncharacterized protein n=1 Tax=Elysia crispata TaxID=231223 RepID=A0AAE1BDL4_9GAST|nr:hypothetical protein RRG08_066255 [Elysia crispata]
MLPSASYYLGIGQWHSGHLRAAARARRNPPGAAIIPDHDKNTRGSERTQDEAALRHHGLMVDTRLSGSGGPVSSSSWLVLLAVRPALVNYVPAYLEQLGITSDQDQNAACTNASPPVDVKKHAPRNNRIYRLRSCWGQPLGGHFERLLHYAQHGENGARGDARPRIDKY